MPGCIEAIIPASSRTQGRNAKLTGSCQRTVRSERTPQERHGRGRRAVKNGAVDEMKRVNDPQDPLREAIRSISRARG